MESCEVLAQEHRSISRLHSMGAQSVNELLAALRLPWLAAGVTAQAGEHELEPINLILIARQVGSRTTPKAQGA